VDHLTKEFLVESFEGLDRVDRAIATLEAHPEDTELLGEIFRCVHTIKGTTGFLGFGRMERLAHAAEHLLGSLRDGRLVANEAIIDGLLHLVDGLRAVLRLIERTGSEGTRASDDDSQLIDLLERLNMVSERRTHLLEDPATRAQAFAEAPGSEGGSNAVLSGAYGLTDHTLRIDVEVLNRMMNLVGDLVLTRNQILQSQGTAASFPPLAQRLDTVTAELRETVMEARLQPIGYLFGKFPRMVRDLARTCGKVVRIEFSGQETGLDKSLLEAIRDPLTHAVRNCIDHGIEAPASRIIAGKSPEGVLRLQASHRGGSVLIDVIDDGGGVATGRVLQKAIERGLVTGEQAAAMTQREVLQLIFLPGFSTSDAVTHVSGRGVGMDVVRANVERLGGSVEIESVAGVGTRLQMRIPLTLAIVPALVVESGGQSFCVPQAALAELVHLSAQEIRSSVVWVGGTQVYRQRECLLPLVRLDQILALLPADTAVAERGFYVAVLETEGCRLGLVIDEILAPEEIVVKPLSRVLRETGLFSGATVLGNGSLALILDVPAIAAYVGVRPFEESGPRAADRLESGSSPEPFLVFEGLTGVRGDLHSCERRALPLHAVERVERVTVAAIEFARGRALLHYHGSLLSLEGCEGGLAEVFGGDASAKVTVLICRRPGGDSGRFAMVVRGVPEVLEGRPIEEIRSEGEDGLVMLGDRVTRLMAGYEDDGGGEATVAQESHWMGAA
jgi:two-component system chemotaxis sensor kinase CheA